jgi:hypothetical protein
VNVRLADDFETMSLIQVSNGIPFQIFEMDGQPQAIGDLQAMLQNARAKSLLLPRRDDVKLAEPNEAIQLKKRYCSDTLLLQLNREEQLLIEVALVNGELKVVIPSPRFLNVRPDGGSFDFERKRQILRRFCQSRKEEVGR